MNLLVDPIFDIGGKEPLSLPEVFAAGARGETVVFRRLRAHQRTAWHMFRVQIGALALRKANLSKAPADSSAWVELLRVLAPEQGEDPWCLTVDDRKRPAFLQPPDPGKLKWERVSTPDELDMLITARNHDLKRAIGASATAEDWVYALVSLQTSEGYGGRSNYGIARMNGGSSSRPFLGLAPSAEDGAIDDSSWWSRDLTALLAHRNDDTPLTRGGPALLWCLDWKEGHSLPVQEIDPWAIEVCRRVRLLERDGRLVAEKTGSKVARLEAKEFNGVLGDAWAPIALDDKKPRALTLSEGRFDYRRIVELLVSGNWQVPLAAQEQPGEETGNMVLIAEALSRGNSKTDGLKSRIVPMPRRARSLLRNEAQRLADVAATQMQEIRDADATLREAVALYAAGGEYEKVGRDERRRAAGPRSRLDAVADEAFFEHLWNRAADQSNDPNAAEAAGDAFRALLVSTVREETNRAFGSIPCASIRAPRAVARARARLEGGLRKSGLVEQQNLEVQHDE